MRLGRIAGIELKVHWTFLLLLAWVAGDYLLKGATPAQATFGVAFVLVQATAVAVLAALEYVGLRKAHRA